MKKLLICALVLMLALFVVACDGRSDEMPTEAPADTTAAPEEITEAPTEDTTEAPTEEQTTEEVTIEEETTEEVTTEEATTEEVTTEAPAPAPAVEPTAYFSAEDIADLTPTNATLVLEDGYVHFLTGTEDTMTNPSITLTAPEGGFTDIIAIKYRTNCGTYGSNYWGTFLLNGTTEFYGNRKESDNWFFYYTDGEWDVLILDMRKHKQGSSGTPDTDVTGGAAIESLVYNFFDYAGNDGKLATADFEDEYIDIACIAFFESKDDAYAYTFPEV